jgi:hypothetical protein
MGLSTPATDGAQGNQVYLPEPPRCTCGQPAGVHEVKPGRKRGKCCSGTAAGPCGCRVYTPEVQP